MCVSGGGGERVTEGGVVGSLEDCVLVGLTQLRGETMEERGSIHKLFY